MRFLNCDTLWDTDQYVIKWILAWKGYPQVRTTMEFKIMFEDGDVLWLPYSKDIDDTVQYGNYVQSVSMLYFLRFKVKDIPNETALFKDKVIDYINIGDKFYMDIRYYTVQRYDELPIEDKYEYRNILKLKLRLQYTILYVQLYGGYTKWENNMRLVDKDLIQKYQLLPDQN